MVLPLVLLMLLSAPADICNIDAKASITDAMVLLMLLPELLVLASAQLVLMLLLVLLSVILVLISVLLMLKLVLLMLLSDANATVETTDANVSTTANTTNAAHTVIVCTGNNVTVDDSGCATDTGDTSISTSPTVCAYCSINFNQL